MRLNRREIHTLFSTGFPNRFQLAVVGLKNPPESGWMDRLTLRDFTEDEVERIHRFGGIRRVKKAGIPREHAELFHSAPSFDSPEEFANLMFQETEGDLLR